MRLKYFVPSVGRVYITTRSSKQKRVHRAHESLAPRGVGDCAEGPESEIRGRLRAGSQLFAAANRVLWRGTMATAKTSDRTRDVRYVAKLLRDGGYSYDPSNHLIAGEARRRRSGPAGVSLCRKSGLSVHNQFWPGREFLALRVSR